MRQFSTHRSYGQRFIDVAPIDAVTRKLRLKLPISENELLACVTAQKRLEAAAGIEPRFAGDEQAPS